MANKKVVGELVYEIRGNDNQYNKVINNADTKARSLGKTVSGVSTNMVKNLAGAYLGWQTLKKGIDGTIGSAIRYEDAFAGTRKTIDASEKEFKALSDRFRELSKEIPVTADEFARIGELAGQLGVQINEVDKFAEVISKVGVTTNLSLDQASTEFARFANIMGMSLEEVDRLGSAIVGLGNNFATTESEITAMTLRIAGAGKTLGLTEPQVLAWATALSSVGINAQMGGSAISTMMIDISGAVSKGGTELEKFAIVSGQTAEEFSEQFRDNANEALLSFFDGLADIENQGGDTIEVLDILGITEVRLRDAVLRLTSSNGELHKAMKVAEEDWDNNTALQEEAEKRFATTKSQIQLLKNNVSDLGISMGTELLPELNKIIGFTVKLTEDMSLLSKELVITLKWLGGAVGLAFVLKKAGVASKVFKLSMINTRGVMTTLTATAKTLRTALMSIPLALVIGVALAGYTAIMKQIKNLKRELNEQVESEQALADMRLENVKKAGELIRSEDKNVQELGKAQNELYRKMIRNQEENANLDLTSTRERIKLAKQKIDEDEKSIEVLNKLTGAREKEEEATTGASAEYEEMMKRLEALNRGSKDNTDVTEAMEEKAKLLEKRWEILGDETVRLEERGSDAIQELADEYEKNLKSIQDNIQDLRKEIAGLESDLAKEDYGIAEKIVKEEENIAKLKEKLKKEQSKEKPDSREIQALTAEIAERELILRENAELTKQLDEEILEARRRASLSDIERSIEDYKTKRDLIVKDLADKQFLLDQELLLEEKQTTKVLDLKNDQQKQIDEIIALGNQRFQDLANNRVKITEDEVKKQIEWYNELAKAIADTKSAKTTSELPQFHKGGYVTSGGEVHAGEYVIPANMVNKYSGLIKALEGARIGSAGSTTNNNITLNNSISEQIDMQAVLKQMSFELNK